jgi:ATP-dependent helicase/nuclease subunit B
MGNVFTIPASVPFAETLARGLIARTGAERHPLALTNVTLYLPTRRSARTLNDAFARILGGAALLPNVRPLGDVEEEDFLFDVGAEALTLPPAISPLRRVLLLAPLVQRWDKRRHGSGHLTYAQAVALSRALAKFKDEVETQGADLSNLERLAPKALSQHWADVKTFLEVLRDEWPKVLAQEGRMNPAARRNLALSSLARRLKDNPPDGLVVGAGSTGSIPATAQLLKTIAELPNGFVVLPGLDTDLEESGWNDLDPGHPQYGLKQLLQRMEIERADIAEFNSSPRVKARETLLREVLRPAPTTDAWRAIAERGGDKIEEGLNGLSLVEAAHPGEEAAAIALMLRHALEPAGADSDKRRTAALVTPDRNLARRVAAEMRRWNIEIDDSAGRPLANTPVGTFLCLVAEAAAERFAPVPLLALLKHPLASAGQPPGDFRRRVRQLDRLCLRGPRPDPGLAGLARALQGALSKAERLERALDVERLAELAYWLKPLTDILRPLEHLFAKSRASLVSLLEAHLAAAESLAASDSESGGARLWRGDDGDSAARFLTELQHAAATDLSDMETSSFPMLFRALAEEPSVRPGYGKHPQLSILGPLEARLQNFDLVILGGLNEGTWPRAAGTDPWLSRPMRVQLGLEQPERRIGLSAHDFSTLASAPHVVLSRALKSEGAPTVASRWLQRLQQLTRGLGLEQKLIGRVPYAAFASVRDEPEQPLPRMERPRPRPPVAARPRRLSVTEIETWLRDPYAIYAKHVLGLQPLDPVDAEIGPLERGSAIHAALEQFLREMPDLPEGAEKRLIEIANEIFASANLPQAALVLWRPRFINAAHWFVVEERLRRARIVKSHLEIKGERSFDGPAGSFLLRARADRIDILSDGSAAVLDYKTGSLPSPKQIKTLLNPQLPLEGAILNGAGFASAGDVTTSELTYIRFGGGAEPGEIRDIPNAKALIADAEAKLRARIADYDNESMPYLPRLIPFRADQPGDYDHLSRVREWAITGWEEPEE